MDETGLQQTELHSRVEVHAAAVDGSDEDVYVEVISSKKNADGNIEVEERTVSSREDEPKSNIGSNVGSNIEPALTQPSMSPNPFETATVAKKRSPRDLSAAADGVSSSGLENPPPIVEKPEAIPTRVVISDAEQQSSEAGCWDSLSRCLSTLFKPKQANPGTSASVDLEAATTFKRKNHQR